ncbi:MAG: TetR family transcriptional regulator [Clostridiales bacterium]|uniref:TetR/AcrR family transcriptional regulator n=1 Tax=Clostridium sp. N3C TaxID=1776758 RepID=UPI00092DFE93|nr:TetR/AcrR family transcriptional regulator [Clostridium sp. N3C]NLZ47588.1 TetR family transcriptional regulator [Clostridiales bacterium]SCN25058.1 putative dihydroxyacetone kinase regulator [Clostridium sp. N3C]
MNSLDARARYTQMMIRNALLTLLKEKNIEKITVKEICTLAGINRATFYRHYQNQYELLSLLQNEMLENVKKIINSQKCDVDKLILLMLQLIYDNKEEWTLLMGDDTDPRIKTKLLNFLNEYLSPKYKTQSQIMKNRFILHGFTGIFDYWIKSGMKESPEEIASYLISYRHALIKKKK